jgi:hypothetical protein
VATAPCYLLCNNHLGMALSAGAQLGMVFRRGFQVWGKSHRLLDRQMAHEYLQGSSNVEMADLGIHSLLHPIRRVVMNKCDYTCECHVVLYFF